MSATCPDCGHDRSQHWGEHARTKPGTEVTSACLPCIENHPGAGYPIICTRTAHTIADD